MFWNPFRPSGISGTVRTPLTPEEARAAARRYEFVRLWECHCGARLKIRSREDRSSGPSNFDPYLPGHPRAGHSRLPSGALTWDGLAEERGWKTTPRTICPACAAKLPMAVYKDAKRRGVL